MTRAKAKKVALWIALGLTTGTAGIGVLHMPFARGFLMRVGGCPAAFVTPKQVELARTQALHDARGITTAPRRPALGFPLERATLVDIRAWADAAKLTCTSALGDTVLTCKSVPSAYVGETASLPPIDEVTFAFGSESKLLTGVTTFRRGLREPAAALAMSSAASELTRALGAPRLSEGLDSPREQTTAIVSFSFRDYVATVTATPLRAGVAVRAEYLSIPD